MLIQPHRGRRGDELSAVNAENLLTVTELKLYP